MTPRNTHNLRAPYMCRSPKLHCLYRTCIFYTWGFIPCEETDCSQFEEYDEICLLTPIGLSPGGSSTVHIYTQ